MFGRKVSVVPEEVEADSNTSQKRKPSKSSQNESETLKRQPSKISGSSVQKEEEVQLDMFFQTMYNITNRLSLIKQIELRREIRQLVLNAEKQDQVLKKQKVTEGSEETTKKSRFSTSK